MPLHSVRPVANRPEGTFGSLRYAFGGDHPSQTARQAVSAHISALGAGRPKGRISTPAPRTLARPLRSLRPILHIGRPTPALSCSKGSRGLFVPSRVIGIFTDTTISLESRSRQRPDHYTIRAGRNLPDKEFRYLRTVIVTAAVYRGFILCASPGGEDPLSRSYGVSLPSSLTVNLPTPQYALRGHVCPFAVRVPHGLCLADFLGSMVTRSVHGPRRGHGTLRFGSGRVLHYAPRRLRPSTGASVTPRRCHFSFPASLRTAVTEC